MAEEATNFSDAREQLEEIVKQVRSKDVSLEKSLDLFEEAIKVGNNCFELIDRADFSTEELGEAEAGVSGEAEENPTEADEENATVSQQDEPAEADKEPSGDNTGGSEKGDSADEPTHTTDTASSE